MPQRSRHVVCLGALALAIFSLSVRTTYAHQTSFGRDGRFDTTFQWAMRDSGRDELSFTFPDYVHGSRAVWPGDTISGLNGI